jgi:hypothetical protein
MTNEADEMRTDDHDPISVDLIRAADRAENFPKDWPVERVHHELARYKKWFRLAGKYPDRPIAPTKAIDEFWHLHMLHPVAYEEDCMRELGFVLDHDGGFGKEPSELPELEATFQATAVLWAEEYHESYLNPGDRPDGMTKCWHNCQSRCQRACKSQVPAAA